MTVKELIEELQKCPKDMKVFTFVESDFGDYLEDIQPYIMPKTNSINTTKEDVLVL